MCAETCSIADNPQDARPRFQHACMSNNNDNSGGHGGAIAAGILIPLFLIGAAGFWYYRKRKQQQGESTGLLGNKAADSTEQQGNRFF